MEIPSGGAPLTASGLHLLRRAVVVLALQGSLDECNDLYRDRQVQRRLLRLEHLDYPLQQFAVDDAGPDRHRLHALLAKSHEPISRSAGADAAHRANTAVLPGARDDVGILLM